MTTFAKYQHRYSFAALRREDGILEVTLHDGQGGPLVWTEMAHRELPELFDDVGSDGDNRVVILTGAGEEFCTAIDRTTFPPLGSSLGWDKIYREGKRLLQNLLDIEVPVIGAINGPARIHAELIVLSDIVIATDSVVLQDAAHFWSGSVPGDGAQVVWLQLLGPNRGRAFLMMAQEIDASSARDIGIVNEICSRDRLLPRAWEIATELIRLPPLTLRYTRVVLTQHLKQRMLAELGYGLSLEGASVAAAVESGFRS